MQGVWGFESAGVIDMWTFRIGWSLRDANAIVYNSQNPEAKNLFPFFSTKRRCQRSCQKSLSDASWSPSSIQRIYACFAGGYDIWYRLVIPRWAYVSAGGRGCRWREACSFFILQQLKRMKMIFACQLNLITCLNVLLSSCSEHWTWIIEKSRNFIFQGPGFKNTRRTK